VESWVVVLIPSARSARSKVGESAPVVSVTRKPVGSPGDRGAGRRRIVGVVRSRVTLGPSRDTHGTHEPWQLIAGRLELLITVLGPLLPAVGGQTLLQARFTVSGCILEVSARRSGRA